MSVSQLWYAARKGDIEEWSIFLWGAEIQTNVISADRACKAAVAHPLCGDEGRIAVLFNLSSRFKVIALPVIL